MTNKIIKLEVKKTVKNRFSYLLIAISIVLGILILANYFNNIRMRFGSWIGMPKNIERTFSDFFNESNSDFLYYWECFFCYFLVLFYSVTEKSFYFSKPLRIARLAYFKVFIIRFTILIFMIMLSKLILITFIYIKARPLKVDYLQNFSLLTFSKFALFNFFNASLLLTVFFTLFTIFKEKISLFSIICFIIMLLVKNVKFVPFQYLISENFTSLNVDYMFKLSIMILFSAILFTILLFYRARNANR
jgi:hypothetical protein